MAIIAIEIDAQRAFSPLCPAELPVAEGDQIVEALNANAALAEARVLTRDAHSASAVWVVNSMAEAMQALPYPHANLTWPRHAEVGSEGFLPLPGLPAPEDYDFLVYKGLDRHLHPYGACFHDLTEKVSTGLIEWLKLRSAQILLIGGLATDFCVKDTVLQLARYGDWEIMVNLEACRGIAASSIAEAKCAMLDAGAKLFESSAALKSHLQQRTLC